MFASLLYGVLWFVQICITLYFWMILVSGVCLWQWPHLLSSDNPKYRLLQIMHYYTEPLFARIRKLIPSALTGKHDLSPLFAMIFIFVIVLVLMPFLLVGPAISLLPS